MFIKLIVITIFLVLDKFTFSTFILNFPRPHELLLSHSISLDATKENVTLAYLYIHGWFPSPERESLLFPINLKLFLNRNLVFDSFLSELSYGVGVVEYFFQQYLTNEVIQIDFSMSMFDANQNLLYQTDKNHPITLIVMPQEEYVKEQLLVKDSTNLPTELFVATPQNPPYQLLQECFSSKTNKSLLKLDYIELGTSDFDTILQQVETLQNDRSEPLYHGISIDAITTYLNRLPSVLGNCKINAAVIRGSYQTFLNTSLPWQSIYYIPAYFLEHTFPGKVLQLKGVAEVNRVSPYYVSFLQSYHLSHSFIRRSLVPSLSLSGIFTIMHQYYPDGVILLKIDLEGMDIVLMEELIEYYESFTSPPASSSSITMTQTTATTTSSYDWPCVIYFESKTYRNDNFTQIYTQLIQHNYQLLSHESVEIMSDIPILQEILESNTIAIHCQCTATSRQTAWELLGLQILMERDSNLLELCSS